MLQLKRIGLITGYFGGIFLIFGFINLLDSLPDFRPYHCDSGGFSVLMPGKPEETTKHLNMIPVGVGYTMVTAGPSEAEFTVMYFEYPKKVTRSIYFGTWRYEWGLEEAMMFTRLITGGKLVKGSESELEYYGYPAKDFELRVLSRVTIKVRAITFEKRCYQLMVKSNLPEVLDKKTAEFFESFKVDGTG